MDEGFLRPQHRAMVLVDTTADGLLDRLDGYVAPTVEKWLSRSET